MATNGGDIRFTFSGDSSGLNAELAKVDNNLKGLSNATTGVSNGLDRKLKGAAERAAGGVNKFNDALGGMSKPVREWDQQEVPKKFDDTGDAARRAAGDLDTVQDAAGSTDSQLSALAGAISHVNPELAEMAGMAADSAGALEGLGRMAMKNPVVAGTVAVAVVAAGAAFSAFTDHIEEAEEALDQFDQRQDVGIARLERFRALQEQINRQFEIEVEGVDASTIAYEEQVEQITNLSAARRRSIEELQTNTVARARDLLALEQQTEALLEQVAAIHEVQTAVEETVETTRPNFGLLLPAADTAELIRLGGTVDEVFNSYAEFEERIAELQEQNADAAARRTAELEAQQGVLDGITDIVSELEAEERGYLQTMMDEADVIRENSTLRIMALLEEMEAQEALLDTVEDRQAAELRMAELRTQIAQTGLALQQSTLAQEEEINAERVASASETARQMVQIAEAKAEQEAAISMELRNEQKLADIERMNQTVDTAVALTGAAFEVTSMMEQHMGEASSREAKRFFRIRQAAAVTDILMTTQQAIMRALADLGPLAGAAAGIAIGATSAAKIGMVMAEKPPAFDVGGMIRGGILSSTPDQMTASVLPGEAILNRSATERLGESGVNALNRGGSPGGVVVVPAYRHFDRFITNEYKKGGSFRRIVDQERQFPVGQRRY